MTETFEAGRSRARSGAGAHAPPDGAVQAAAKQEKEDGLKDDQARREWGNMCDVLDVETAGNNETLHDYARSKIIIGPEWVND